MDIRTETEIVLTKVYRERHDASDILYGDAPNEVPLNVPAEAFSWFVVRLWEGNHLVTTATGETEREAMTMLFVLQNQATIDAMLKGARVE